MSIRLAGSHGKHCVAVADGVAWADGHGQAVVADAGEVVGFLAVEPGVGGDYADGGVHRPCGRSGRRTIEQNAHRVIEAAVLTSRPGHKPTRPVVPNSADGVDSHDCANRNAVGEAHTGRAKAALDRARRSAGLGYGCSGSRAYCSLSQDLPGRGGAGGAAFRRAWPHLRVHQTQVVDYG